MAQQKLPPVSPPVPAATIPATKAPPSKPGLPRPPVTTKRRFDVASMPFWMGLLLSLAWACGVFLIVMRSGPTHTFGGIPLTDWAIGISAIVSPVALVWMVAAYIQRAADVQAVAEPLRRQLSLITGESGAAEARIRRFNQAIREQIELLRGAQGMTKNDLVAVMERVRSHKSELERLEQTSIHQVKDIQDIIRGSMQQVEHMMDDKFTMMRVLDDKLLQNGDSVARHVETVRHHIANLLEEIEGNSRHLSETLTRAMQDSKKLSDTSRAQENSLITAAESAAETLGTVSGKIDLSVARFMERAGVARQEAERLAGALDVQTRALDEFSNILPTRVGEAESVLRGVADRLYASEQMAREQAVNLSDKLSSQVDNLEQFMEKFTSRLSDIDGGLQQRQSDLDSLGRRIGDTTENFAQVWEDSIGNLGDRANSMLARFSSVSDETRERADQAAAYLSETIEKYEVSSNRMRSVSEESATNVKALTTEIATHLEQFESLRNASQNVGEEIQGRATAAMQNFQHVLERLLAARDVVQSIGGTLVKDLHGAVDQNEHLIGRLNEAAQMSVRALGIAAESLGRQENALTLQARAAQNTFHEAVTQLQQQTQTAEKGLREQAVGLISLLGETQTQMNSVDEKMQSFAVRALPPVQEAIRQIDTSADQGLTSMARYGEGLQEQLARLQQFNGRMSGMGEELGRVTIETASSIENLSNRFAAARAVQEETVRHALQQFNEMADRLQREVTGLDGQAMQAVSTLQQAAARVGEQSYQLLQNAENSGSKMQLVTTALQNEASQIRSVMQKQADDLGADLSRAEKQFTILGEALRQRTDAAYALLDRVAVHYNETTRAAAQELETRTHRIEQVADHTQGKVETLNASLSKQVELLEGSASKFETQATDISSLASKTLQQLSAVNEKFAVTNEAANSNVQATIARLDECSTTFMRQSNSLSEVAQTSTALVHKAGVAFGEQAGKLLDTSHQMDQSLRQLTTATAVLADQSTQIRNVMEQQNQRLIAQLTESVSQMESSSSKLERSVNSAMLGADQVSSRITEVTQSASQRLDSTHQEMQGISSKAESTLAALGANITQQAASLAVISEQLNDQYRTLGAASESQRAQLVDLFDKLGAAHGQSSEVAERTITRLSESLQQIQRQLGALSDQSQTAVGNVRAASAGFGDQAAVLLQNAQQAEQQARTVLSVTAALQDQARVLRESLHGESERTHEILGSLLGRISAGGVELRDLGTSAELVLNSLQTGVMQQASALNNSMQQIADRQRTLTVALDAQRDVINGLLSRLTLAQDETASTAERTAARLADGTQQLTRQIEVIDTQAQSTLAGIQAASARFADEAGSIGTHAQQAEQQMRGMLSVTTGMHEQARQLREALHGENERTHEILSNLLSRINTGGSELRDIGSTTEQTLTSLQSSLTQQAGTLNGTMQQVSDRQRALTAAFDAQQKVLDDLIARFTSVQDQTAVTAERTSVRLTEGAQQLARQIEVIDTQAQSALANVQGAGARFADEAGSLGIHAQKAEQQMRGVLSATAGMQEQARQLREAMQSDGERTHEVLGNLLNRISSGGLELRDIGSTTEQALTSLQGSMTQQAGTLNGTMQQITERQRTLTAALDSQRNVIDELLNRLIAAQDQTALAADRTMARLTDGAEQLERKVESIDSQTQSTLATVQAANAKLADEAGALGFHAQQAEQQMRGVLSITATLQDQARQLREAMQGDATQAQATIGGLMGTISSSGSELRELGVSIEHVLGGLQNGLTQQTGALNGTMQQITERQQTLTIALESQRRVIDELLGRLTLAQDETASVAERTAARLADGAQQLARQIEVIDTQAQSTLANVRVAGAQFADEAGSLGIHAHQAEQQMRGVLSVTAGMQEQARQLRESMQGESSRVIEQLSAVITQLDMANSQLKAQGQAAVQVVDSSSVQFGTLARTSAEAMSRQAEFLSQTVQDAEVRMTSAGEKLKTHTRIIGDMGDQAEQQTRQLADAAEYASSRIVTLRETLTDADRDSRDTLVNASQRIEEVKAHLQDEMRRLSDLSQDAVQKVAAASQQLTVHSDVLRSNLAISESALTSAAQLVRDESMHIPAMIDTNTVKIENAAHVIKIHAGEAEKTLIGTADRFIGVTTTARESMVDEMRRVSAVADEAGRVLSTFNATLAEQVTAMREGTSSFSTEQKDLIEKASESIVQLSSASDRLAALRRDAAQTAEKMAKDFEILDQRATDTGQRLTHMGETVSRQVEAIADTTQRAEGQMMDATRSFREQFERVRSSMQGQIDDINRGLMQITAQLERTGNTLRSTTAGTVADVERISQRFDQTSQDAANQIAENTSRMRGATEEVANLLTGFGDQLDVLLDRLSVAGDGIKRHEGDLIAQLETALSHLASLASGLENGRVLATTVSQQAVQRLNDVVETIQQQSHSLTMGSQTAAGIMRGVSQIYNDQTQALTRGVGEAHGQVQEMNKSIDDMQQRADRMRVSLKMQSDELMSSLQQILHQLNSTGDALSDAVDGVLQEKAAQGLKKIG